MSEFKQQLTENDLLSVFRLSKLFSDVSNEFKMYMYHIAIVDQLQDDKKHIRARGPGLL